MQTVPHEIHHNGENVYLLFPSHLFELTWVDLDLTWACLGADLGCPGALVGGVKIVSNSVIAKA